jgi:hypothetical protein
LLLPLFSNFDDKGSDNPDIPLGDNGSMNNTSDINDCISIEINVRNTVLNFQAQNYNAYT